MKFSAGATNVDIVLGALACLLLISYFIANAKRITKGLRYPPGPPGRLIGGNAKDMPTHHEWETYDRWAKEYGDIVHVKVYGQSMIFINTMEVAQDLFDKRSSIYSDRFEFPMLLDLMGWDFNLGLMRYGERWRRHRKMFQQKFHAKAVGAYHQIQIKQTRTLLRSYYYSPEKFTEHLRYLAGATIMEVVYGIQTLPTSDPYIETAERAMVAIGEAGTPGTFLVDTIPILKYVPEWLPGAGFKKKARLWRIPTVEMSLAPFKAVKQAMTAGTASEASVTVSLLEELAQKSDAAADEEEVIRNVGAVAFAAGSDTTVAALTTFMLAMVLYPEVQRKAQEELDSTVGNRLPGFEDKENLPYISAVCKEVHRWHPVFPQGVAHRLMQDDVYAGYFIPRGSVVLDNAWSILHDEKVYGPRPREFEPERFEKPGAIDPVAQYGFGRRVCAGRYMAENSLWLAIASILKVFDISRARDENGEEITVEAAFCSGFISRPDPFKCSIKPRSVAAEQLILENNDS